jgi:hypothetical protein
LAEVNGGGVGAKAGEVELDESSQHLRGGVLLARLEVLGLVALVEHETALEGRPAAPLYELLEPADAALLLRGRRRDERRVPG